MTNDSHGGPDGRRPARHELPGEGHPEEADDTSDARAAIAGERGRDGHGPRHHLTLIGATGIVVLTWLMMSKPF